MAQIYHASLYYPANTLATRPPLNIPPSPSTETGRFQMCFSPWSESTVAKKIGKKDTCTRVRKNSTKACNKALITTETLGERETLALRPKVIVSLSLSG